MSSTQLENSVLTTYYEAVRLGKLPIIKEKLNKGWWVGAPWDKMYSTILSAIDSGNENKLEYEELFLLVEVLEDSQ